MRVERGGKWAEERGGRVWNSESGRDREWRDREEKVLRLENG